MVKHNFDFAQADRKKARCTIIIIVIVDVITNATANVIINDVINDVITIDFIINFIVNGAIVIAMVIYKGHLMTIHPIFQSFIITQNTSSSVEGCMVVRAFRFRAVTSLQSFPKIKIYFMSCFLTFITTTT